MLKKLLMLCVALALSLSAGFAAAVEVNSADQAALESVANAANRGSQTVTKQLPSLITVEVLGFGDCDPEAGKKCQE